ncbi:hypothetical protein [Magnetospirillum sp. LM-5]|uniref:hypothetical protein n=1 Tax=Magnetospirillum sp. LM-5 TaxID=2681466 RepID=UPI00156EA00D|nr:hypothetical protein [Magnetospirillum sp. LM-5]
MSKTRLRIGIICEGPTDFVVIRAFVGASLTAEGVDAEIIDIQPEMDGKAAGAHAGWGNIEQWLLRNPPDRRVREFLRGGLFMHDLHAKACDVMLIQMDADILDEPGFQTRMFHAHGMTVIPPAEPADRGAVVCNILARWARLDACSDADTRRHLLVPAVESTETWCLAAFRDHPDNVERLRGDELNRAFMDAVLLSERRPTGIATEIDKDPKRREKFCRLHAQGHGRLRRQCGHFDQAVVALVNHNGAGESV